jgi:hypothetical protein
MSRAAVHESVVPRCGSGKAPSNRSSPATLDREDLRLRAVKSPTNEHRLPTRMASALHAVTSPHVDRFVGRSGGDWTRRGRRPLLIGNSKRSVPWLVAARGSPPLIPEDTGCWNDI